MVFSQHKKFCWLQQAFLIVNVILIASVLQHVPTFHLDTLNLLLRRTLFTDLVRTSWLRKWFPQSLFDSCRTQSITTLSSSAFAAAEDVTSTTPTTIAVIGCGPGGMFFLHALETRRRELAQTDPSLLSALPVATCFERGSSPGGVWRAKRQHTHDKKECSADDTTNMYKALWTNGPKEGTEFFDYTFDDHFGRPLPVYMPRQAVLDYITTRVTRNCPDFFEKYAQFDTSVELVTYKNGKFQVSTRGVVTGETQVQEFDKCIWAAGANGKPNIPAKLLKLFDDGGFQGRILHSSDAHHLKEHVQGKRVLLIGGGYSAKDLALMSIKLGVEQVYITSCYFEPYTFWTGAWPMNKVKVYAAQTPVGVLDGGRSIQLAAVKYMWPSRYKIVEKAEILRDIDTVIFCTGYEQNLDMIDKSLKWPYTNGYEETFTAFPENWNMTENVLSNVTGHVEPDNVLIRYGTVTPGLYRGVLIENPNMMYLLSEFSSFPLLAADVSAWLLMGFVTGTVPLPSPEEMARRNDEQTLADVGMSYSRYWMDRNYRKRLDSVDSFWVKQGKKVDPRWYESSAHYYKNALKQLAQLMREANYPLDLGTMEQLNEKGEALYKFDNASYFHRVITVEYKDHGWKTFRDFQGADQFYSIHTGTKSVPLKGNWLDLDDHDPNLI